MPNSSPSTVTPSGYYCPMHADMRQRGPGACPQCGMDLVPVGARFPLLQHMRGMPKKMARKPWILALMLAVMAVVMAIVMMR